MNVAAVRKLSPAAVRQRERLVLLDLVGQQKAITRCAHCRWSFRGTVANGKAAFATHSEIKHGRKVRR